MNSSDVTSDYVLRLSEMARARTLEGWDFPASSESQAKGMEIRKVGVIGAGVMGSGIAQWCAVNGFHVVLRDVKTEFIERGWEVIRRVCEGSLKRGKLSEQDVQAALSRIETTTTWDGFAECDLVIEAIVEDVGVKQKLFTELAEMVRPDALLASNTSALPIEEIAGHVSNPERTLGMHFFNPVGRMPLVELILGRQTSENAATRGLAFVKELEKSPVICRSAPGFLVTRVLFFYLNEACRIWEEGASTELLDSVMREWGWPMGPMRLIDEVGVDVADFIFGELAHYFPGRFQRSTICERLLSAELKGRKNGASSGFYTYEGRESSPSAAVADFSPSFVSPLSNSEISDRLMSVMINEARRCLDEGVIKTPEDVDFALLSGAGFPASRGGLMHYAKSLPR